MKFTKYKNKLDKSEWLEIVHKASKQDIDKVKNNLNFFNIIKFIKFVDFKILWYYIPKLLEKTKPNSECYPYEVHDYFEIFGNEKTGFEKFYLVGDNWKYNRELPIVVVLGCNSWKLGFIAEYLNNYRCAFAPRKLNGLKAIYRIKTIKIKPHKLYIWGYTDNFILNRFLSKNSVIRIEDGFIRSADLGVKHTLPYSLVFDDMGLYYNPKHESRLEYLLKNFDLDKNKDLLQQADELLKHIKELSISKYNLSIKKKLDFKTKKRIGIIGQVDKDKSLMFGNIDKYSIKDIIKCAIFENPDADIYYRPHPDTYKNKMPKLMYIKKRKVFITDPTEDIISFIENMDAIYTITSTAGFDAVIRGKEVKVFGASFYSGLGLTDDRCSFKKNKRILNIQELFAIIYLVYPQYLANSNSYIGLTATIYKIDFDRNKIRKKNLYNQAIKKIFNSNNSLYVYLNTNQLDEFIKEINFDFLRKTTNTFQVIFILLTIGKLKNTKNIDYLLYKIRNIINAESYKEILSILKYFDIFKIDELLPHYMWLNTHFDYLNKTLVYSSKIFNYNNNTNDYFYNRKNKKIFKLLHLNIKSKNINTILEIYNNFKTNKEYFAAKKILFYLLIIDYNQEWVLNELVYLIKNKFDFESVINILDFLDVININLENHKLYIELISVLTSSIFKNLNIYEKKQLISKIILSKDDSFDFLNTTILMNLFNNYDYKYIINFIKSMYKINYNNSLKYIIGLSMIGDINKANILLQKKVQENPTSKNLLTYANFLYQSDKLNESLDIVKLYLKQGNDLNKDSAQLLINLYIALDMKNDLELLMPKLINNNIEIAPVYHTKYHWTFKNIVEGLWYYKLNKINEEFIKYYENKFFINANDINKKDANLLLLACYGPGDEIIFSMLYSAFRNDFKNLTITVSPKLYHLFQRTFKNINFIPTERVRNLFNLDTKQRFDKYNKVKALNWIPLFDNNGVTAIDNSEHFSFISNILSDYFDKRKPTTLEIDKNKKNLYKQKLHKYNGKILIGLSWRSSIVNISRNIHYLQVEEIAKIFTLDSIMFINLQYDECENELNWIEKKYPNKIINFNEIDQYNDLDTVAALMSNLDLVIAPCNTVAELAGAVGCKTWLFTNTHELDWRISKKNGKDVWYADLEILRSSKVGDRQVLVDDIYNKLIKFVDENNHEAHI